jgi:hypothetical protein
MDSPLALLDEYKFVFFFQYVFPMTLGSLGPKTKWPRAQDKTLRGYETRLGTQAKGIIFLICPWAKAKILICNFLTCMAFLKFRSPHDLQLFWSMIGLVFYTRLTPSDANIRQIKGLCKARWGKPFPKSFDVVLVMNCKCIVCFEAT